jgi:putative FmdB family regulatory protein
MPLYEYECAACGYHFERIQRFSDPLVEICPSCGKGPVNKLLSASAVHFKGTGWYVTDYPKKGSSAAGKAEETAAEKPPEKAPAGSGTETSKPAAADQKSESRSQNSESGSQKAE